MSGQSFSDCNQVVLENSEIKFCKSETKPVAPDDYNKVKVFHILWLEVTAQRNCNIYLSHPRSLAAPQKDNRGSVTNVVVVQPSLKIVDKHFLYIYYE